MKLCECGCGEEVKRRFKPGHNTRLLSAEEQGRRVELKSPNDPYLRRGRRDDVYRKSGGRHVHRTIAEEKIGRPLRPGEIVHHIDHNRQNNHPSNLEVMTQAEHCKAHGFGGSS